MKRLTKILLIISLSLAGLGIVFCILGFALGVNLYDFRSWINNREFYYYEDWEEWIDNRVPDRWISSYDREYHNDGEKEIREESSDHVISSSVDNLYEFENINNIDIDIKEGTARVIEYEGTKVKIETDKVNSQFNCYLEDDNTLVIEDQRRGQNKPTVLIYLPKDAIYDKIEIDMDAADLTIDNLSAGHLDIEIGGGKLVSAGILMADNASMKVGAGYMEITEYTGSNIDLTCGAGELIFHGFVTGENDIECGIGHILLVLDGDADDFDYELKSNIGSIDLDGKVYTTTGSSKHISNNSDNTMNLNVGIGSIEVRFK